MTKIVIFDTETTGLPKQKKLSALQEPNNWPNLVSICWMVFENRTLLKTEYYIIQPNGWQIPEESSAIHGITQEQALKEGKALYHVLGMFQYDLQNAKFVIAHNLDFDKNVLFNAYKWYLGTDPTIFWPFAAEFCTAKVSKNELKLPPKFAHFKDFKFPKLDELYEDTFKKPAPQDAHNAMRDVDVLQQIVWKRWNLLS